MKELNLSEISYVSGGYNNEEYGYLVSFNNFDIPFIIKTAAAGFVMGFLFGRPVSSAAITATASTCVMAIETITDYLFPKKYILVEETP